MDDMKARYRFSTPKAHKTHRPSNAPSNHLIHEALQGDTSKKSWKLLNSPSRFALLLILISGLSIAAIILTRHSHRQSQGSGGSAVSQANSANQQNQQVQSPKGGQSAQQSITSPSFVNEAPAFTVYYPSSPPQSLTVDKSTITYSKNSFSFNLAQNGQDQFYVNEQPAGDNFSYQRLKARLGSPNETNTALGMGIFGTIGVNFITAVRTDKNTLIIVNCAALECGVPSKNLINSMQINNTPTRLR
ncbi:MAG TPA: hypothetical protein VLE51_03235 [Candidatus Saccharimonadales bacterium]|nr:hypothetical protein [Candidatus Saccharimonadales bacterium]